MISYGGNEMTTVSKQDSDEARVIRWVTEHGGAVRGYLIGLLRRDDLADDLVQEVFRRAWEARERYAEQGSPRAYLLRIADRLACDHLRRSHREVTLDEVGWGEVEPVDRTAGPGDPLIQSETNGALTAALDSLTGSQRRVLLLRYYGEMSFEEIASALECPLSTALSHCRRGLLALRKIMTENHS
jgi:RNA polymerase sigma factor (sigma-70 family)